VGRATAPTPRGVEGAQQQRQVQIAQVAATRWVCDPDRRELLHEQGDVPDLDVGMEDTGRPIRPPTPDRSRESTANP
jgi:hypothetical protein